MLTINNTVEGYLKDVEIKGNTWQDSENLADIRSVGTKVEGQELYEIPVLITGENIFNGKLELGTISNSTGLNQNDTACLRSSNYIKVIPDSIITVSNNKDYGNIVFQYDKNKNFISRFNNKGKLDSNCYYIKFRSAATNIENDLSVVYTVNFGEYKSNQPYQEDKLTILSPTPLEKVGDVADRIICKDGVWGVEKNIEVKGFENISSVNIYAGGSSFNTICFTIYNALYPDWYKYKILSNHFVHRTYGVLDDIEGIYHGDSSANIYIRIEKSKLNDTTTKGFTDWARDNKLYIKYPSLQTTFIPLPHDQQIKLRTFADRTHISFDTEIQPTLKAQVPKSLGATVNTHTSQIDNLSKELDRVKKLEESTVSTVTSDKAFTTVAETNGGYFEDVKIEGKTLVNLSNLFNINQDAITDSSGYHTYRLNESYIKANFDYTLIFNSNIDCSKFYIQSYSSSGGYISNVTTKCKSGVNIFKVTTDNETFGYRFRLFEPMNISNIIFLEGDHTDKDITFFEGLKSVGQDSDEISVLSSTLPEFEVKLVDNVRINYRFTEELNNKTIKNISDKAIHISVRDYAGVWIRDAQINPNKSYTLLPNEYAKTITLYKSHGWEYIEHELNNIVIINAYNDKKQILYYNPTTQTWEKPVLREWDSIEKRGDKYYYIKRSEEVVFDGSENWVLGAMSDSVLTELWGSNVLDKAYGGKSKEFICDSLPKLNGNLNSEYINLYPELSSNKSVGIKLSTQKATDLQTGKQWLQANPVTLVYKLAQEEVYECTNLDLITYNRETNLIVNSGAIQPKLELKVLSNISNVVKLLQEKVSVLENNTSSYIVTQNRLQLASTYAADSVTFKVDYASSFDNRSVDGYNPDLYNLILSNILVGKDNYDYYKMFSIILDYASWDQISWEQFDELVLLMDIQHNPPIEIPEEDYTEEEIPEI